MAVPAGGGEARPLVDNGDHADSAPAWSSDGEVLAFIRDDGVVWTARADGTGARRLADVPNATNVRWRPDGRALVVNTRGGVFLVEPGTGGLTLLGTDALSATWAPDGEHLYWWAENDADGRWRLVEGRIVGDRLRPDRDVGPVQRSSFDVRYGLAVSPCA
jgi:Tol biopolymer transport system component